jgi:hypothetical protein
MHPRTTDLQLDIDLESEILQESYIEFGHSQSELLTPHSDAATAHQCRCFPVEIDPDRGPSWGQPVIGPSSASSDVGAGVSPTTFDFPDCATK